MDGVFLPSLVEEHVSFFDTTLNPRSSYGRLVKVGFSQKVMAKFSNLSNRHACEPKIVSELLFPVNVINTIWVIF